MRNEADDARPTLLAVRRILLAILLLGMVGTATELLLLDHVDGMVQLVPLVLIALGCATIGWHAIDRGGASVRSLQVLMLLFVASGFAGMLFHYRANVEYQHEVDPALAGRRLIWKVLQAKAPPALAPGVMAQLGLLGLAYAYRHPSLRSGSGRGEGEKR